MSKTAAEILFEHILAAGCLDEDDLRERHEDGQFTPELKAMTEFASQESDRARMEENESMLELAKLHGNDRMVIVINERIRILKHHTNE